MFLLQTGEFCLQVAKDIQGVSKALDKAMATMDLSKVSSFQERVHNSIVIGDDLLLLL